MRFYHRKTNTAKAECPASAIPRRQCRSYSSKRTKQREAGSREPDPEQEILTTPTSGFPPHQQQWTAILKGSSKSTTYQGGTTFSVSWGQREGARYLDAAAVQSARHPGGSNSARDRRGAAVLQVSEWRDYSEKSSKSKPKQPTHKPWASTLFFHERCWRRPSLSRKMQLSIRSHLQRPPKEVYKVSYSNPCTFNFGMMDRHTDICKHQENHSTSCLGPNPSRLGWEQ